MKLALLIGGLLIVGLSIAHAAFGIFMLGHAPDVGDFLLLEDSGFFLLENGSKLVLG